VLEEKRQIDEKYGNSEFFPAEYHRYVLSILYTYKRKGISVSFAAVLQKDFLTDTCRNKQTSF